jgi:hypothetical protein
VSQQNDIPHPESSATWQSLRGEFMDLEQRAILQATHKDSGLFFAYWNRDEPCGNFLQIERDKRRAWEKEAQLSANLHAKNPKMVAAEGTKLGFFCFFASRETSEYLQEQLQTLTTRIRREFQCFRSKGPEKPVFVSKIFAALARFSQT